MSRKKTLAVGSLIAGVLIASSGCVVADRPWYYNDGRDYPTFGRADRGEMRANYARLEAARARLAYDLRHDASRYRIARDRAEIQAILDEIERDRRYSWNTNRGRDYDNWEHDRNYR
jgi:hypothetical protein